MGPHFDLTVNVRVFGCAFKTKKVMYNGSNNPKQLSPAYCTHSIMHVERNEKVDFRTLLRCSLRKVCTREGPEILERCLDAVLPICTAPETKAFLED